jgi:hypothetical protein
MSLASIVTMGYAPTDAPGLIVTMGYGLTGTIPVPPAPPATGNQGSSGGDERRQYGSYLRERQKMDALEIDRVLQAIQPYLQSGLATEITIDLKDTHGRH